MFRIEADDLMMILPSPQFGDSILPVGSFANYQAMDGSRFTYAEPGQEFKLLMNFSVTRSKALEVEEFMNQHLSSLLLITTHRDERYSGNITNNPFETTPVSKGEYTTFTIEFQGEKL